MDEWGDVFANRSILFGWVDGFYQSRVQCMSPFMRERAGPFFAGEVDDVQCGLVVRHGFAFSSCAES